MNLNNKNKYSSVLAYVTKASISQRLIPMLAVTKGLNFSSLYQTANFSSNSINQSLPSSIAYATKDNNNNYPKGLEGLGQMSENVFASANASNVNTSLGVTAISSKAKNNNIDNILIKQGLGPIKNGFANKLLNYKFIGNNINNKNIITTEDIIKLISAFFKSIYCLISRPKFINTNDKIIIEILYYITIPDHNVFKWYNFIYNKAATTSKSSILTKNNKILNIKKKPTIKTILFKNFLIKKTLFKLNNTNIVNLYINKFNILFKLLQGQYLPNICAAQIINKPIEFNLIRLHKSDYDSNILAQLFILILKKKNIRIAINKLYTKNNIANTASASYLMPAYADQAQEYNFIPAYISGLYIKIGGRLMREPIIPRLTTKKFEIGAIATGKVNLVDSARITQKNKKGAYTIKITYAQNFVI